MEEKLPEQLEEFLFLENQLDLRFSAIVDAPNQEAQKDAENRFASLLGRAKAKGMGDL